jgi:hypothetical protein
VGIVVLILVVLEVVVLEVVDLLLLEEEPLVLEELMENLPHL